MKLNISINNIGDILTLKKDTDYKYVVKMKYRNNDDIFYVAKMKGLTSSAYTTAKEAAIVVDKYLISKGKEPINILVKK